MRFRLAVAWYWLWHYPLRTLESLGDWAFGTDDGNARRVNRAFATRQRLREGR
jgi:hypothetical protein